MEMHSFIYENTQMGTRHFYIGFSPAFHLQCGGLTLLQGLTWFSATQTGCRWLISYIEQKKFLACGPEFSVEFSAPPEFSGGVTEKYLSTGRARTSDLQIMNQAFYHCPLVCKTQWHSFCSLLGFSGRFCSYRKLNFPAVSGSYLPGFSGRICSYWQPNFPAVSGSYLPGFSGRICSYRQPNFPSVPVVTCHDFHQKAGIFRLYLCVFLSGIFRP